jgi:hypothetical protein
MSDFTHPATFATIPIGGQFVEVFTSCDEIATRIEPITHQGKPVNARRSGGKLIFMAEWEPVLISENEVNRPDLRRKTRPS